MPQILVDENVPISVMKWLKKKGLKATRVSETELKGAKDENIAKYAVKNDLIILTLDTDFAYIYYNVFRGLLTAIVVRVKPPTPANIIEALNTTLKKIKLDELQKKLTIITKKKVRIIAFAVM